MINWLWNWFVNLVRTPSSFKANPWGYARNQMGHAYALGFFGALHLPLWSVLTAYIILEIYQLACRDSDLSDSIEDFSNVLVAALAAVAFLEGNTLWWYLLAVHLAYLAAGFAYRVEQRRNREV